MKKNKKKLIMGLCLFTIVPLALPLSSCSKNNNSSQLSNDANIDIVNPFNSIYGVGEIVDLNNLEIEIHVNNDVIVVNGLSNDISIDSINTSQEGTFNASITYKNFTKTFEYQVKQYYLTLDFNSGVYQDKTSITLPFYNNRIDVEEYIPVLQNEENKIFAGWYLDKECYERASFYSENEFYAKQDVVLYAGYDVNYSDKFIYTIDKKERTVIIKSLNFDTYLANYIFDTELVIPATIEGYDVVEVGKDFLIQNIVGEDGSVEQINWGSYLMVSSLIFPSNSKVKVIGDSAFNSMSLLSNVQFPSTLETIGESAFLSTGLGGTITFPKTLQTIGKTAFSYLTGNLEKVTFEKDSEIKIIGENAFANNSFLSSVELPEGLEEIRDGAFGSCNSIKSLTLPSTVSIIGNDSFMNMNGLQEINISENNKNFCSVDGNVYSKDMTRLIRYCYKNDVFEFTIPNTVVSIADYAFSVFNSFIPLTKLNINDGLTYIGRDAFNGCSFEFKLPKTLNSFSLEAFGGYKGKKIDIDPLNEKYKVKDGILYSADYKTLYVCPEQYEKADFILDDNVTTLAKNAFISCSNIITFTIGENSSLKTIDTDAFALSSMTQLKYLYIKKTGQLPFNYVNFVNNKYLTNSSYIIIFDDLVAKNSFMNTQVSTLNTPPSYVYLKDEVKDKALNLINEQLGLNLKQFNEVTNFNSLYNLINIFSVQNNCLLGMLTFLLNETDSTQEEYNYMKSFEKMLFFSVYYSSNSSLFGNNQAYTLIKNHYKILPTDIQNEVKYLMDSIDKKFYYLLDEANNEKLYIEIIAFPLNNNSFDYQKYQTLKKKIDDSGISSSILPDKVNDKLRSLDISAKIYELLNTNLDNLSNLELVDIYNVINPSQNNNFYGLNFEINGYYPTDSKKEELYKYDEYQNFLLRFDEKIDSLKSNMVNEIADFDLSTFNYENYFSIYETCIVPMITVFPELITSDFAEKMNFICAAINCNYITKYDDVEIVDDNFEEVLDYLNLCTTYINALNLDSISNLFFYSNYLALNEKINNFASTKIAEFKNSIKNFVLDNEHLIREDIIKLYNEYNLICAYNQNELIDDDINYVDEFNVIMSSYLIKRYLEQYSEITDSNISSAKKYYFGYYDLDDLQYHEGAETYINTYLNFTDSSKVLNYDKYIESINLLK